MTTVHHHYHYHYYYSGDAVGTAAPAESVASSPAPEPATVAPGYVRQGQEILTKDRGILSSYGYYDVEKQTVKYRRLALLEATQYLSKDYIQERLYHIAMVQPEGKDLVFWQDLKWFERTFQLTPYSV